MEETAFNVMPKVTGPWGLKQPGHTRLGRCRTPGTGQSPHRVTGQSKSTHIPDVSAGLLLPLTPCSQEAAGPSFSPGWAVQCRAGGCRAEAVRRLGQLPMDAEDTVPHGELSPFCPFTDQVHGLVAPMTAAIVHLSVPFTAVNPAPKRAHTHTHTGQGVSSRAPGRRSNRAALTKGWQEPRTPGALTMNLKCPGFFQ